jgi:hypothetical protein
MRTIYAVGSAVGVHAAAIGQLLAVEIQLVAIHQPKQAAEQRRNVAARH